jgi:hypothetical protein
LKHTLASLKVALKKAPAVSVRTKLTRLVPELDLGPSPDWLFTSGKPGRYNPAGVDCVYFGETREVAQSEYENYWKRLAGANQPVTTYYAAVVLRRVLDLTDDVTVKALGVNTKDLFTNWRRSKQPTLTQLLGQAVNETGLVSAIRYPSKAAVAYGKAGVNFVIFRDCVRAPDSVRILGPARKPLQKWP